MALSFSDKMDGKHLAIAGVAFRVYEVTHDGSETSMDASDFDLSYIYSAIPGGGTIVLSATSTIGIDLPTNHGASISMTAMSSGATTLLWLIGY